jgi:hypothetical protein
LKRAVAVALLSLACVGCVSVGSTTRAATIGRGNFDVGAEAGAWGGALPKGCPRGTLCPSSGLLLDGPPAGCAPGAKCSTVQPTVNALVDYGVTDGFDVGLRAGSTGGELRAKLRIAQLTDLGVASFAPSAAVYQVATHDTDSAMFSIALPLLLGFSLGRHELTFGWRAQVVFPALSELSSGALLSGLSAGASLRATSFLDIALEVAIVFPLVGGPRVSFSGDPPLGQLGLGGGWIATFAVAVRVGRLGSVENAR